MPMVDGPALLAEPEQIGDGVPDLGSWSEISPYTWSAMSSTSSSRVAT